MALDKASYESALSAGLKTFLDDADTEKSTQAIADALAGIIADATDTFVKTGTAEGETTGGAPDSEHTYSTTIT